MNSSLTPILSILVLAYLVGMFQVWGWAIVQLFRRRPLVLPRFTTERSTPPWGLGTMVLVFLLYLGTNLGVIQLYVLARGQNNAVPPRPAPAVVVEIKKSEPAKAATPDKQPSEAGNAISKAIGEAQAPVPNSDAPTLSVTEGMFLLTLINELLIVAIPLLVRMTSGARLRDLGWIPGDWERQVKIGVGASLLITPIVYLIQYNATLIWTPNDHPVQDMIVNQFSPAIAYLAILSACVMAPVVEEIMFRGLIQTWLFQLASRQEDRKGPPTEYLFDDLKAIHPAADFDSAEIRSRRPAMQAIVMTSFFFAVVHSAQWPAPIPIFLLSMALGIVYHLTGSLLASIAMHAAFNSLSTLMLFMAMTGNPKDLPIKKPLPQAGLIKVLPWPSRSDRSRISTSYGHPLQIPN